MLRWNRLVVPVAGLALVLGFAQARSHAADPAPAAEGKASVTVTVVDSDGKPVSGANVSIVVATPRKKDADPATTAPTTPPAPPTPIATGTTDDNGKAVLEKIPDGKYRVRARMKKSGAGTEAVTIEDGKDATVSVTLKPRKPKGT